MTFLAQHPIDQSQTRFLLAEYITGDGNKQACRALLESDYITPEEWCELREHRDHLARQEHDLSKRESLREKAEAYFTRLKYPHLNALMDHFTWAMGLHRKHGGLDD